MDVVECHLARANPHWKDVASGNEALMIFQGPEGYITPNWYPSKADEHGKVVPDLELCNRTCTSGRPYENSLIINREFPKYNFDQFGASMSALGHKRTCRVIQLPRGNPHNI